MTFLNSLEDGARLDSRPDDGARARLVLEESEGFVPAVLRVLGGEATGALSRGALSADYCEAVRARFERSAAREARADGVPGDVVGPTQYGKTPSEYMAHANGCREAVSEILGGADGEFARLLRDLAKALASQGAFMRPLIYAGEPAPMARIARWTADGDGRWLLRPHDDLAQTRG